MKDIEFGIRDSYRAWKRNRARTKVLEKRIPRSKVKLRKMERVTVPRSHKALKLLEGLEMKSPQEIKRTGKYFSALNDKLIEFELSAAWTRKEGKRASGGLNQKGVESYRRANPGSKLRTAVTRDPSTLKKGSKASKRRASFCARMSGMKKRRTSAKTANDPNSRINKSLRKWNCESLEEVMEFGQMRLPFGKDPRPILVKQGDRVQRFRKLAKAQGHKNWEKKGEEYYYNFLKKNKIKHEKGNFSSWLGDK